MHTIEGRWPSPGDWEGGTASLDGSKYWPHFIVAKDRQGVTKIGQYIPLEYSGRALSWGNRDGVVQVEIGGKAASPFTNNDPALTHAVSSLYQALCREVPTIPCHYCSPHVKWLGSSAYGKNGKARLFEALWYNVSGLVGHQHVPTNSHWDPGAIDCSVL